MVNSVSLNPVARAQLQGSSNPTVQPSQAGVIDALGVLTTKIVTDDRTYATNGFGSQRTAGTLLRLGTGTLIAQCRKGPCLPPGSHPSMLLPDNRNRTPSELEDKIGSTVSTVLSPLGWIGSIFRAIAKFLGLGD